MQQPGYKRCGRCRTSKPLTAFHRDRHQRDGRTAACGECINRHAQELRDATADERDSLIRARVAARAQVAADQAVAAAALIEPGFGYWFAGFTDGEGTFTVRVARPKSGANEGQRFPVVQFSVCQHIRDRQVLDGIRAEFGFGKVAATVGGRMSEWRVLRQADCEVLAVVFARYLLRTAKREDFAIWLEAVKVKRAFIGGGGGIGGRNAETWTQFETLADSMASLRQGRRAQLTGHAA